MCVSKVEMIFSDAGKRRKSCFGKGVEMIEETRENSQQVVQKIFFRRHHVVGGKKGGLVTMDLYDSVLIALH